ncbi:MAG: cobalt-precorrin-5B (C(1))-methyltransferase CbiD [Firmicutes bacterium]|nr:cobalt-precorrin-5B (C(1))-methyltransferase CbiD [Bacillota bacterium]
MATGRDKHRKSLRSGYTTGTCAAAACQAALQILLTGELANTIIIDLPGGGNIEVPVKRVLYQEGRAIAEIVKDAGDDPDVTNGISIFATVELLPQEQIIIQGGMGVGTVTKPGLALPVGETAINPVPLQMIRRALQKILPAGFGAKATISVPQGEKVALRTLNPRLGIIGGISILGTTGIVRPMSDEAYVDSLLPQIDQALALGHSSLVLTPGGMGARKAREMGIPEDAVVQTSNFIGIMLDECADRSVPEIILLGHIGKLIKVAAGIFNTHSKIADGRRETLAAHAAMMGAESSVIRQIMELNTLEASVELIKSLQLTPVYYSLAEWVSKRCRERLGQEIKVGTILYALNGEILGYDAEACEIGVRSGWPLKLSLLEPGPAMPAI